MPNGRNLDCRQTSFDGEYMKWQMDSTGSPQEHRKQTPLEILKPIVHPQNGVFLTGQIRWSRVPVSLV